MKKLIETILLLGFTVFLSACGQKTSVEPVLMPTPMSQVSSAVSPTEAIVLTATPLPTEALMPTATSIPAESPVPTAVLTATCTPAPTATPKPSVTLVMVGDILLHTRIHEYSKQENGSYNYDAIFANLKEEISSADLALVNQEVIIGGEELGISGYPSFNAPKEAGEALVKAGFDVVLHATNHALDKKGKGVLNTLQFWGEHYPEIGVLGIHDSKEDQEELYITEIEGIRIAILNYTYGTNGIAMPKDMPYAVDMLEKTAVKEDIRRAKEQADIVIVCPHWGTEYRLTPDEKQKQWTELFLEEGVDLVLGTHPHVIEPVELLMNPETGEQMPVFYSIGNFVNWTSGKGEGVANRMVGGIPEITIERDEKGNAYIADYRITAIVCHVEKKTNGITVYPLSEYTEELAERNAIKNQDPQFSLEYCTNLCNEIWGDLWK
ncbi:MAG: CapA family protein [Lachnospiraceae bacterium]|nr:CapA family protein [Lachnospiraceae bacterium]